MLACHAAGEEEKLFLRIGIERNKLGKLSIFDQIKEWYKEKKNLPEMHTALGGDQQEQGGKQIFVRYKDGELRGDGACYKLCGFQLKDPNGPISEANIHTASSQRFTNREGTVIFTWRCSTTWLLVSVARLFLFTTAACRCRTCMMTHDRLGG